MMPEVIIASLALNGKRRWRALPITTVSEARPHIRHHAVTQRGGVDDGGLGGEVRRVRRAAGRRARPRGPARAAAGLHGGAPPPPGGPGRRAHGPPPPPPPGRGGAPA